MACGIRTEGRNGGFFMKKGKQVWISLLLCAAMTAITACSDSEQQETATVFEEATPKPKETEPETEPIKAFGAAGELSAYSAENSNYQLQADVGKPVHDISELLYGIFFEDINFAADGGLYAELVKNRSFEFTEIAKADEKHGWSDVGSVTANVTVGDQKNGLNLNNTNYMVIENTGNNRAGIANEGFLDGMAVTQDAEYTFSIYAKGLDGYTGPLYIDIMVNNESVASGKIDGITNTWKQYSLVLKPSETANKNVMLQITMEKGRAAVDMVSLFPKDTYKNRENGLRKDLVEKLKALQPAFLRFPGGCIIEGRNLGWAYDWKDSIGVDENRDPLKFNGKYGDVAARKQQLNLWMNVDLTDDPWPSYMTYGLGFYEYFQLAEDIGAIGVPVLNCGLSHTDGKEPGTEAFDQYIQNALDLVEFCRGGADTKWGAVRIAMGHEKPFALKYIGIGNEQVGNNYYRRYEAFVEAFAEAKQKNPDLYDGVELMYSAGFDDGDSGSEYLPSYEEAERWLEANPGKKLSDFAGATDHHYYNTPEWFLEHTDYYDEENYSRTALADTKFGGGIPVFLGEYAAQSNTLRAALAEAAYMTGLERNGDIVVMAAYAPLFGNKTAPHWSPDLIWFNNHSSTASIDYYVQQIFSVNAGTALYASTLEGAEEAAQKAAALSGKIGVGTWNTSASFDNVKIVNNDTGEVLGEQDFERNTFTREWEKVSDGDWSVKDGALVQASTRTDTGTYANTGTAAYFGEKNWKNYTFTVDATKTGGDEGFLIPFAVEDKDNNYFWNIGGWGNTVSALQKVSGASKSDAIKATNRPMVVRKNRTYHLKIVVTESNIKCYIDDQLYVDYTPEPTSKADAYQVVSTDETGDIILKLVNVTEGDRTFAVDLKNAEIAGGTAKVEVVAGENLKDENKLDETEKVTLRSSELSGIKNQFNYTVPKYSVTVLRIPTK